MIYINVIKRLATVRRFCEPIHDIHFLYQTRLIRIYLFMLTNKYVKHFYRKTGTGEG